MIFNEKESTLSIFFLKEKLILLIEKLNFFRVSDGYYLVGKIYQIFILFN